MGDNLRIRGFDFIDWCIMCRCNEVTVDHLLLHSRKAHQLWSFVFRTFGILWVPSRSVADFLFSWWNWLGKHSSNIWNLVPLCLMWCIWRLCSLYLELFGEEFEFYCVDREAGPGGRVAGDFWARELRAGSG